MSSLPVIFNQQQKQAITTNLVRIKFLTAVMWILIIASFFALVGATADGEARSYSAPWHAIWLWCVVPAGLFWLIRLGMRFIVRGRLWATVASSLADANGSKDGNGSIKSLRPKPILNQHSIVLADATSYSTASDIAFTLNGVQITTAELEAVYSVSGDKLNALAGGSLDVRLKLRVFTFRTSQYMPHIFISSRKRSLYTPNSRNMGLIDEKLPQRLKFQALEGDFNDFFDVYAIDNNAIDILRILSPDVMIELRDQGVEFDIEIIDRDIYFYVEPSIITPEQIEAILDKAVRLARSLGSEMNRGSFYDRPTNAYIPVRRTKFYGATIAARFSLVAGGYLAYVIAAVLVGEAIASLYTS